MSNNIVKIVDSTNRLVVRLYGDAVETGVLKIDVGSLAYALNANGKVLGAGTDRIPCYSLYLRRAFYDVNSDLPAFVRIASSGDSPNTVATFSRTGSQAFDEGGMSTVVNCATTANSTGNLFLSTVGFQGNMAYSLVLDFRKEAKHFDQGQTADPKAFNR